MLEPGSAGVAKYHRVANKLRELIESRELAPGDPLPPESELEREFGYNRTTVRRGISVLQGEGLIDVIHGKGTFVRERRLIRRDPIEGLLYEYERANGGGSDVGLFEAMTGTSGSVKVEHAYASVTAAPALAEAFDVEEGTELLRRTFFYLIDGGPHQLVQSYLRNDMVAGTPVADPANERPGRGTMAQLRDVGVHVDRATLSIVARMPNPRETELLNLSQSGTPAVVFRRIMYADGRAVEVADIVVPGDRLEITMSVDLGSKR